MPIKSVAEYIEDAERARRGGRVDGTLNRESIPRRTS